MQGRSESWHLAMLFLFYAGRCSGAPTTLTLRLFDPMEVTSLGVFSNGYVTGNGHRFNSDETEVFIQGTNGFIQSRASYYIQCAFATSATTCVEVHSPGSSGQWYYTFKPNAIPPSTTMVTNVANLLANPTPVPTFSNFASSTTTKSTATTPTTPKTNTSTIGGISTGTIIAIVASLIGASVILSAIIRIMRRRSIRQQTVYYPTVPPPVQEPPKFQNPGPVHLNSQYLNQQNSYASYPSSSQTPAPVSYNTTNYFQAQDNNGGGYYGEDNYAAPITMPVPHTGPSYQQHDYVPSEPTISRSPTTASAVPHPPMPESAHYNEPRPESHQYAPPAPSATSSSILGIAQVERNSKVGANSLSVPTVASGSSVAGPSSPSVTSSDNASNTALAASSLDPNSVRDMIREEVGQMLRGAATSPPQQAAPQPHRTETDDAEPPPEYSLVDESQSQPRH